MLFSAFLLSSGPSNGCPYPPFLPNRELPVVLRDQYPAYKTGPYPHLIHFALMTQVLRSSETAVSTWESGAKTHTTKICIFLNNKQNFWNVIYEICPQNQYLLQKTSNGWKTSINFLHETLLFVRICTKCIINLKKIIFQRHQRERIYFFIKLYEETRIFQFIQPASHALTEQAMRYNVTLRCVRATPVAVEKQ